MIIAPAFQFYVYLNVKALGAFNQPGEGSSRGLLRDYEPSDGTFSSTSHLYQREYLGDVGEGADLQQGQRLEEAAGADDHKQLGEEVEVCLEVRVSTEDSRRFHNHGEGSY